MKKLILDTNIIVSAAIAQGYSRTIVKTILFDKKAVEACLSEDAIIEYEKVSGYSRIQKSILSFLII